MRSLNRFHAAGLLMSSPETMCVQKRASTAGWPGPRPQIWWGQEVRGESWGEASPWLSQWCSHVLGEPIIARSGLVLGGPGILKTKDLMAHP